MSPFDFLSVNSQRASRRLSDLDILSLLATNQDTCSEIVKFYSHRSVFLTGASGFLGKAILEKLLRICPKIQNIYVLIRPKFNVKVEMRLEELLNNSVFENLREMNPTMLKKVIPVPGDLLLPDLGISLENQKFLENNVSVVINSAATVKFNENLKSAFNANVNGVCSLISLCKRIKNLTAFVHLSTAYANCDQQTVDEVVYPVAVDPKQLAHSLQWMGEDAVDKIEQLLIGNKPNTYTYTKSLAEYVVNSAAGQLPTCIIRPSIVGASWKEPMPGWIDNTNGPTGIIFGVAKGLLHVMKLDKSKVIDFVPVDFTVNLTLAAAWETASEKSSKIKVYNCCSGIDNPVEAENMMKTVVASILKNPISFAYGYPFLCYTTNSFVFKLFDFLLHYLPALVFDACLSLKGKQPRMTRVYNKIAKESDMLSYFRMREWKFVTVNTKNLYLKMSSVDQRLFDFDMSQLDWKGYFKNYCNGARKYICKEDNKTIGEAIRRQNKIYWIQVAGVLSLIFIFALVTRLTFY